MKKMKVFLAVLTLASISLNAQAQKETHTHQHLKPDPAHTAKINDLLKGFDEVAANATMDSLQIAPNERAGYLRYMKAQYIKAKYPSFNFADLYENPYRNYTPQLRSSRNAYCSNAAFEDFNFNNWFGGTSFYGTAYSNTTIQSNGANATVFDPSARHTIVTTPALNNNPANGPIIGYDELAINPGTGLADIPLVAPNGSGSSCRLGNANTGAEIERLYYEMNVTTNNTTFYYQFAIVLQDPSHPVSDQPYFHITVKDQSGTQIGGTCGLYDVNSTLAATDPSFVQITYAFEPLYYRNWELVSIDLSAYVGQTITIEFETADCNQGGHFGYAYIDAGCGMLEMASSFCSTDANAVIAAPTGFAGYQWYGPNNSSLLMSGQTNDTLLVISPVIGDTYYVNLQSASGCNSQLSATMQYTTVTVAGVQITNSCPGGASGSATVQAAGSSQGYTYLWTPGNQTTASVTGLAPGNYNIHIEGIDPSCGSYDSLITIGTNPISPISTNANFCSTTTLIIGPAGSNYQWYGPNTSTPIAGSTGTNDSLTVNNPNSGDVYYLSYTSSQGCNDSIIYTMQASGLSGFFNAVADVNNCGAATVSYQGSANPTFSYSITGPGGYNNQIPNTSQTLVNLTGLAPGTYTASVFDAGCSATSSFDINLVASSSQNLSLCPYGPQNISSTLSGTHNWYGPTGTFISSSVSPTLVVTNPAAGTYTDTTTLSGGCQQVTQYIVSLQPTTTNTQNLTYCALDTATFTSASAGTHEWYSPSGVLLGTTASSSFSVNGVVPGQYRDSCITSSGCLTITNYNISYTDITSGSNHIDVACYGDNTGSATVNILTGPPGTANYSWSGPNGFTGTGSTQSNLEAGTYTVIITNGNCEDTNVIVVAQPPQPQDTLVISTSFCDGDPAATLYGPAGYSNYQWYFNGTILPGETTDSLFITDPGSVGSYTVTYDLPPSNCPRTTSAIARTTPAPAFLPDQFVNVFSPNSDGVNDMYYPFSTTAFTAQEIADITFEFSIKIYDRWGILVFESESYSNGWTGMRDGKDVPEGVYFWMIHFTPKCAGPNDTIDTNGFVHVKR